MTGRKMWFVLVVVAAASVSARATLTVSATVDKTEVAMGESLLLEVRIAGDRLSLPSPELPPLPDFRVASAGNSSNITFGGAGVSAVTTYRYMLSPVRTGRFRIGPVVVRAGSVAAQSEPLEITVTDAVSPRTPQQRSAPPRGSGRGIFVEALVDRTTAYVAQQVTWTFRFYTKIPLLRQPRYAAPDTTGFHQEDLPPQRTYETVLNGERYSVVELKVALFPIAPGPATIGPATLVCTVQDFSRRDPFADDFFGGLFGSFGREIELRSDPITVTVIPLPEPHPPSFTGAVGTYRFEVKLDGTAEAEVNRTQMLTIAIRGTGNIGSVSYPKTLVASALGDAFAVFDPVTSAELTKENYRVAGAKVFSLPIAPLRAGPQVVPTLRFTYFDPVRREYVTLASQPIPFTVKAGQGGTGREDAQRSQRSRGVPGTLEDIRYIMTKPITAPDVSQASAALLIVNVVPPMVWCVFAVGRAIRRASRRDGRRCRFTSAYRRARRSLQDVRRALGRDDVCRTAERLHSTLAQFLADRMDASAEGLTLDAVRAVYRGRLPDELLHRLESLWEDLHFCRFAPGKTDPNAAVQLLARTQEIIGELDNETQKI